jgi:hypothetical protein
MLIFGHVRRRGGRQVHLAGAVIQAPARSSDRSLINLRKYKILAL